jgi:hypothetical protein
MEREDICKKDVCGQTRTHTHTHTASTINAKKRVADNALDLKRRRCPSCRHCSTQPGGHPSAWTLVLCQQLPSFEFDNGFDEGSPQVAFVRPCPVCVCVHTPRRARRQRRSTNPRNSRGPQMAVRLPCGQGGGWHQTQGLDARPLCPLLGL